MPGFRAVDLQRTLAVTEPLVVRDRADPFPSESLEALGSLVGADAVGYCESLRTVGFGGYELATRPAPPWLPDALRATALQDPTHPVFCGTARRPVAVSDFVAARELRRREIYDASGSRSESPTACASTSTRRTGRRGSFSSTARGAVFPSGAAGCSNSSGRRSSTPAAHGSCRSRARRLGSRPGSGRSCCGSGSA